MKKKTSSRRFKLWNWNWRQPNVEIMNRRKCEEVVGQLFVSCRPRFSPFFGRNLRKPETLARLAKRTPTVPARNWTSSVSDHAQDLSQPAASAPKIFPGLTPVVFRRGKTTRASSSLRFWARFLRPGFWPSASWSCAASASARPRPRTKAPRTSMTSSSARPCSKIILRWPDRIDNFNAWLEV